jgi:hypothetical protein
MADYAISNVPRRVVYAASGTGPYAFTFEILNQTDIAVYKASTLLTLTTDYTVTINANGTGSVTLVTTAGTSNITIVGAKNIQRTTDFTTGGDLFANTLNDELDNQTIFIQQVAETAERGLKAPVVDPTDINMTLPAKASRVGTVLAFNATTGNPEAGPSIGSVTTVAAQSANINTVASNIGSVNTVAGNITNVNTVAGVSSNVTTVASNIANVNAVGADLLEGVSEINTVAVDIANVNTVGTNIASVNTVAGEIGAGQDVTVVAANLSGTNTIGTVATNIANVNATGTNIANVNAVGSDLLEAVSEINTVATDITNVNTVGTNIGSVNTVAGISSNVSTVAGISANVTTVAGINSAVSTVASNNANVTTVATNIASVNTCATDIAQIITTANDLNEAVSEIEVCANNIANINTVGTNISNVNTVAGISANVTTVATNVADINNYADTYQGAKATDPTLRNDGSALQSGDLYFNTTDDVMKVREAGAWLAAYASLSGALIAANNLSDLTSASTARTNLGLGTIATQAASSVAITGGSINGATIGATTASTGKFSDLTDTGLTSGRVTYAGTGGNLTDSANLTFSGTVLAVTGAITSTTTTTLAQTNGQLLVLGSETAGTAKLDVQTASGTAANLRLFQNGVSNFTISVPAGTDALTFSSYAGERMRIDANGRVQIGTTTATGTTKFVVADSSGGGQIRAIHSTGSGLLFSQVSASGDAVIQQQDNAALLFGTNNTERMRLNSSGNLGIGTTNHSERLTIAGGNARFQTNSKTRIEYLNSTGAYVLGTTGGAAVVFEEISGSHEIAFETHHTGFSHAERMRITKEGNIQLKTGGTKILNSSGNPILQQTGSVLQVVSTNYTTRTVIATTTSYTDMTGMTVSITPTSATSKIFVIITLAVNSPDGQSNMVVLDRNGTQIGNSTSSGGIQQFFGMALANTENYRLWTVGGSLLDSPATTSALTYKLRIRAASGTSNLYLNGTGRNLSEDALGSSTITVMEIAA